MMSNTLQQGSDQSDALGYTRAHCRIALNLSRAEKISIAEVGTLGFPSSWFNGAPLIPPHFKNRRTLAVDTFVDIL